MPRRAKAAATSDSGEKIIVELAPNPEIAAQTKSLAAEFATLTITTPAECVEATRYLGRLQKLRRWVDGIFKTAKQPLTTAKKQLDANHNASVQQIRDLEDQVEARILAFQETERQERARRDQEERERRELEARKEQEQRAAELRAAAEAAPSKKVAKLLTQQAEIIAAAEPIVD